MIKSMLLEQYDSTLVKLCAMSNTTLGLCIDSAGKHHDEQYKWLMINPDIEGQQSTDTSRQRSLQWWKG